MSEPEFQQAYEEVVSSLEDSTLFEQHPEYRKVLPIVSVPERIIQFKSPGRMTRVNKKLLKGYRVQYNSPRVHTRVVYVSILP
ncbi:ANM_collapsed_G0054210.mRNA.1.CDS.1 [Saccharomyces cerevisiae]|nr:ANM_collapsed_G0054210.mRNA.1.CDS.1 [Saccharomyces cerevisiae]